VVSHDREFLKGLTQKVYEFGDQKIKEYIGDIEMFLSEKDLESFKQLESSQKEQKTSKRDKSENQFSYNEQKRIKKLKNKITKLEKKIDEMEISQKEIDLQLSDPDKFKELSKEKDFFERYEDNQQKKKKLELEWEQAVEELGLFK